MTVFCHLEQGDHRLMAKSCEVIIIWRELGVSKNLRKMEFLKRDVYVTELFHRIYAVSIDLGLFLSV